MAADTAANLAQGLKVGRVMKHWKQQDLADASGVKRDNINRYENQTNMPRFDTVVDLADALECSLDALAGRDVRKLQSASGVSQEHVDSETPAAPKLAGDVA